MRWANLPPLFLFPLLMVACGVGARPRSEQSFSEISDRVHGMTAAEVVTVLGEPDSRQAVFLRDERWVWWNYTFLAGNDFPPEVRGQVVHLEIIFNNPTLSGREPLPYSEWKIAPAFGVSYQTPGTSRRGLEMRPQGTGG